MSLARRRRLVELAEEYDVVVLEDTPYRELRYEGERLPTIASLDPNGRVVHLGSFSKILAPGLRLGWALATPEVREKLSLLKLAADTQNGTLNMRAAAAYLEPVRHRAAHRRDAPDLPAPARPHARDHGGALPGRHHLDPRPRWPVHLGDLPASGSTSRRSSATSSSRARGSIVVPGTPFFADRPEANHARMSFSGVPDARLVAGVRAMGGLLAAGAGLTGGVGSHNDPTGGCREPGVGSVPVPNSTDNHRRTTPMPHVRRFDHVGITVADLDAVTAFFVGLGLEVEGRTVVEGEFVDTVTGIPDSRSEIVMLRPPGGGTLLELSSFVRPDHEPGSPAAMANELGLRNVAFEVDDVQAAVDDLAADGYGLVGGIGEYENTWRMAYVRGPEGIIVSLAARIG